ncbi:MAG TPA: IS21 family transposase [Candidatus Limnocylindrales bacterium]|nr:IS21 family transposase [Candidatus Limnocylindrales bacterium]
MASGMVTDAQVKLLRRRRKQGQSEEAAAAAAGISLPTARRWRSGPMPSHSKSPRHWRTRIDPFAELWDSEILPLLISDTKNVLQATTIIDELARRHGSQVAAGQVRTLQRRIRDWRALHGPQREVFFQQVHEPGREAACDFTHCNDLEVTIAGEQFDHLLFTLTLSFSGRGSVTVAYSESYEALVHGLQRGLHAFGGSPSFVRMDNMSAATHELRKTGGRALNKRFAGVLDHYVMRATLITAGRAHENGVAEQRNYRVKSAIAQALILRGSRDFVDVASYQQFADEVTERSQKWQEAFAIEREHLRALPPAPVPEYTVFEPKVRRWSTICIGSRTYSVPSRLIGHQVLVHQHPEHVDVYYGGKLTETMPRLRGKSDHRIDYRHIIASLVRKPGAFARYRYRESLFPTLVFRRAYDRLCQLHGERADVEYVRILDLAARAMECLVGRALETLLSAEAVFGYAEVKALLEPEPAAVPVVRIGQPNLGVYDELLMGACA